MSTPTPTPSTDMKPCPYCGKMTSAQANFCYWCAREIIARPERPEASLSDKPLQIPSWVWIVLAGVVVIALSLILILH
jgi:uncharacterized membrane protein YvbJ